MLSAADAGSPEEGCWLVKKEEIQEARSESKPVLHRQEHNKRVSGSMTARRSSSAMPLPDDQQTQKPALSARGPPQDRSGSSPAFVPCNEPFAPTEAGKELRFNSVSTGRSDSTTPLGITTTDSILLGGAQRSPRPALVRTPTDASPVPNPPDRGAVRTTDAIVFGAFKPHVISPVENAASGFTATNVNSRRSLRGVVVGTPPPSPTSPVTPEIQGEDDSVHFDEIPCHPTTATTPRVKEEVEPTPSTAAAATTPQRSPSAAMRLLSEDAAIPPSAATASTDHVTGSATSGVPTVAAGAQTMVASSISFGVQVECFPAPKAHQGIDMCVGGDEPLPSMDEEAVETAELSPEKAKVAVGPITSEMGAQTDALPTSTVARSPTTAVARRAPSTDPFEAGDDTQGRKKADAGCCLVM